MFSDFIGGFLGAIGGLVAGVVALRYLIAKYIEIQIAKDLAQHKHGLDKQLTTLQTQLSRFSDVLSRRNEREFKVVEDAWGHMIGTWQMILQGSRSTEDMRKNVGQFRTEWAKYRDYLRGHEIFFRPEIYEAFIKVQTDLFQVIWAVENAMSQSVVNLTAEVQPTIDPLLLESVPMQKEALAKVIRARFGFSEK